jgi:hypothetical protein
MATLTSPTLQNLLTGTRRLLNQPDPQNSFWKDDELTDYLNEGVRLYFVEVLQVAEGHFNTTTNLNIVSGTEAISLPSDCFQVRTLWKAVNGGYETLSFRNTATDGYGTDGGTSGSSYKPSYSFRGNSIILHPTPNFSETAGLKLEYVQFPETMVFGGDSLTSQVSPLFKQVIEIYAVYKAKLKESLVSGVNVHKNAEEHLGVLVKAFRDAIAKRTLFPTYVQPYNPENG